MRVTLQLVLTMLFGGALVVGCSQRAAIEDSVSENTDQIDISLKNNFGDGITFNQDLSWVQNGNYGQVPDVGAGETSQWTVYGDPTDPPNYFEGAFVFTTSANDVVYLTWWQQDRSTEPIYEIYGTDSSGNAIPAIGGQVDSHSYSGTVANIDYSLGFNEDYSPAAPTNLSASYDQDNETTTVSWDADPDTTQTISYYDLMVDNGVHTALMGQTDNSGTTTLSLQGLTPGSTYRFQVKAIGDHGSPAPSAWLSYQIP